MKTLTMCTLLLLMCHFTGLSQQGDTNIDEDMLAGVEAYIYSGELTRRQSRQTFRQVKELAETDHAEAICMLGILYKDGIGTTLNFNKARRKFKKAYDLGSGKAAYSLGYLYLKGLGNIDQDYAKAKRWFERSDYPMAKHWLAKMHYFGHGVPVDRVKAMNMLRENMILNSYALLQQFENDPIDGQGEHSLPEDEGTLDEVANSAMGNSDVPSEPFHVPDSISGNWHGYLIELDWSGEKMLGNVPVDLTVGTAKDNFGTVDTRITINNDSIPSEGIWNNGSLTLFDAMVTLPKRYTDNPNWPTLDYDVLGVSFTERNINGAAYLVGEVDMHVRQWSEPSAPMMLVLAKDKMEFSEEILDAFAHQGDSFIKLYPNPFVDNLLIYYELPQDANVNVSIQDYYGQAPSTTVFNGFQRAGERTVSLNNLPLNNGLYVVRILVNGTPHTKLVIKK